VTVLAYRYGAGLCELLTAMDGAPMDVLIAAGIHFQRWPRFALPLFAILFALGAVGRRSRWGDVNWDVFMAVPGHVCNSEPKESTAAKCATTLLEKVR
jgi:hypothetical protein